MRLSSLALPLLPVAVAAAVAVVAGSPGVAWAQRQASSTKRAPVQVRTKKARKGQARRKIRGKRARSKRVRGRQRLGKARSQRRFRRTRQRAQRRRLQSTLRSRRRAGRPGIIATIGPSSKKVATLRKMIRGGMEVARFNLSHGDAKSTAALVEAVRKAAKAEKKKTPTLLFDLPGGKIRLGAMGEKSVTLREGEPFDLFPGGDQQTSQESASVDYPELGSQVKKGDRLLLDDGHMELQITGASAGKVQTEVVRGGDLRSNLGLALKGRDLPFPDLSAKDARKIEVAVKNGAHWIGVSMVQSPKNLTAVRRHLQRMGAGHIKLVAKIESHSALKRLDAIIDHSDAVMIARGDLATVVGAKGLPKAQEQIASRARAKDKPFIVASNLMSGMNEGARPTRANVADVARTRRQSPGWLMLNETATGKSPPRIVEALRDLTR